MTEKEIKERDALYSRNYQKNNKEKVSATKKKYYYENRDDISKKRKKHYLENKDDILRRERMKNKQLCFDPKEENVCTYNTLYGRKYRNKEKYKDVILKDCIIQPQPQS